MEERTELRHDLHELRTLRNMSSRHTIKRMLDEKITEIEDKVAIFVSLLELIWWSMITELTKCGNDN